MSTSATGRLISEQRPLAGLVVAVRDDALLRPFELGRSEPTRADGRFTVLYRPDQLGGRSLRFQVLDRTNRVVHSLPVRPDVTGATLALGDIEIPRGEVDGFLVTLGTGVPSRLSLGNTVHVLLDGEAFDHAATLMERATSSIHLTQLYFSVPERFQEDAGREPPSLVFRFDHSGPLQAGMPARIDARDRPERILIERSRESPEVDVRILLNRFELRGAVGIIALYSIVGLIVLVPLEAGAGTDADEVSEYFAGDTLGEVKVGEFRQQLPHPMHCKLLLVDGREAMNLGSPFSQGYFGDGDHAITDLRRGGAGGYLKHDVSVSVNGPAVAHLHEAFKLHWDTAIPDDPVPALPAPAPGTGPVAVQVVRTLTADRFAGMPDGEKGILEAYLRAIGQAREYVYLETQYFTHDAIGDALVGALNANDDLDAILMLNIKPDVPFYPWAQKRLVRRIRDELRPAARERFAAFSRWTHEPNHAPRPWITPIYLHSKIAIVDDRWATIGSANLDGTSLDTVMLMHAIGMGEERATEVNVSFFNGVEGQPPADDVARFRRRLWAEHLGLPGSDQALLDRPTTGWLRGLWRPRAAEKLRLFTEQPSATGPGHVVPYPGNDDFWSYKEPRAHLTGLGVPADRFDPITAVPSFEFETGTLSEPEVDVPPPTIDS